MRKSPIAILVLAVMAGILLSSPVAVGAAEETEVMFWSETEPARTAGQLQLTPEQIEHLMERLRKAEPERAEELEKLRKDDPAAFKAELRKILRRRIGRQIRTRTEQGPGEHFGGGREERAKMRGGREGPEGGGWRSRSRGPRIPAEMMDEYIEWLEENYPDEAKKLADMQQKNPDLYGTKLRLGFSRYRRIFEASRNNPELAEILKQDLDLKEQRRDLLRKIRTADKDHQKKLTEQLKGIVGNRYDLIVRRKQIEYEQMLERLKELQQEVQQKRGDLGNWKDADFKNRNVQDRVQELTGSAKEFKWE
jgi:hypothetical protein